MVLLEYATIDVFTAEPARGNPLAVVRLPASATISQEIKQLIAKEFNYSETVFIHVPDAPPTGKDVTITVDIFTIDQELPFAGHPTVGSSWYILNHLNQFNLPADVNLTLKIKAGFVPVQRDGSRVCIDTPVDLIIHKTYSHPTLHSLQPALQVSDYHYGTAPVPVASIGEDMSFFLLRLSSVEALGRMQPFPKRLSVPEEWLGEWRGFIGVYPYVLLSRNEGVVKVRTRMFDRTSEDPATGAAASLLSAYLASEIFNEEGRRQFMFEITQGVEMGRQGDIYTQVHINEAGRVEKVELCGTAVKIMEGRLVGVLV